MANVSLCTVCVILIVFTLHKPEALCLNIDRSLCLETIVKFMHDQQKCHFNYTHASGLLNDDNVTCQTKCHVAINGIYSDDQKLGKVELKFGGKINEYEPCISTNTLPVLNMNITCLAWNEVKVPVGGYCTQNEQCQGNENSGVCEHGRCVCRAGYTQYNFKCLEVKVLVGGYCTQNEQCQGNENSGVCEHGRCVCRAGYIQYNLKCLEGNLALNQPCSFSEQCAGSPYASCLGGICSCIDGYTAEESTCVQIKVPVGGYCTQNEQCQGHENSGVCEMGRCVCRAGYIQYNLKCLEGNLAFNHPCSFSEQCTGSPYASCLGGKCSCIDGYTAEESTCVQSQKSILSKFQHQEANIGTTLGALFGGLLLGMILTTVALVIIYRQSKAYVNKRDEFNVKFSDNDACSSAKVVDPNAFQNMHTKDEKREVSPYLCSEETSMHNNVYEKLKNGQTQDDVNNHLYEKLK